MSANVPTASNHTSNTPSYVPASSAARFSIPRPPASSILEITDNPLIDALWGTSSPPPFPRPPSPPMVPAGLTLKPAAPAPSSQKAPSFTWTPEDEHALQIAHLDILTHLETYHLYYDNLRTKNKAFRVPIITLSAVTSGASFSFAAFPKAWNNYFQVGVGVISLVVTILSGLEGHFKIPFLTSQTEGMIAALLNLSQHTSKLLRIRPENRTCSPADEIKYIYETLGDLIQQSGVVIPASFMTRSQTALEGGIFTKLFAKNDPLATHLERIRRDLVVYAQSRFASNHPTRTPQQLYDEIRKWGVKRFRPIPARTTTLPHSKYAPPRSPSSDTTSQDTTPPM